MLLLERDLSQPDRIVGELLQPGGYLKLRELGLAQCVDGIDSQKVPTGLCAVLCRCKGLPGTPTVRRTQVYGYCMFREGKQAKVHYPMHGHSEDVAGRSFHNGRFVQRLRQAAASQQGVTVRQGTVNRLLDGAACLGLCLLCAKCMPGHIYGMHAVTCESPLQTSRKRSCVTTFAVHADQGQEWRGHGAVHGVQYKTRDGTTRTAAASLTLVCDGMYSSLRRCGGGLSGKCFSDHMVLPASKAFLLQCVIGRDCWLRS